MECTVTGILHEGQEAVIHLRRTGSGWVQTEVTETARHLRREYVSHEPLHNVVSEWMPVDFKQFDCKVLRCCGEEGEEESDGQEEDETRSGCDSVQADSSGGGRWADRA